MAGLFALGAQFVCRGVTEKLLLLIDSRMFVLYDAVAYL